MLTLVWVWRRFSLLLLVILQSSKMMITRRKRSQRCLLMPVIVPRIVKRKRGLWSRLIWLHGGKGKRKKEEEEKRKSLELKLEASKRKLQLGYQQVQKAKRKIQLVDLRDIPKPEPGINLSKKSKCHYRHWWSTCWWWWFFFVYFSLLDLIWFLNSLYLVHEVIKMIILQF